MGIFTDSDLYADNDQCPHFSEILGCLKQNNLLDFVKSIDRFPVDPERERDFMVEHIDRHLSIVKIHLFRTESGAERFIAYDPKTKTLYL